MRGNEEGEEVKRPILIQDAEEKSLVCILVVNSFEFNLNLGDLS